MLQSQLQSHLNTTGTTLPMTQNDAGLNTLGQAILGNNEQQQ